MIEIHLRHGQASPETGQLTDEGIRQAVIAGQYIRNEYPRGFGCSLHSPSSRAAKTAELLAVPNIDWKPDDRLIEKHSEESWAEVRVRCTKVAQEIDDTYAYDNRILVYHGEAMRAMRACCENFTGAHFWLLFEEPYKYFNNTQLIIYTDEPPDGQPAAPDTWWVKSICPWANGSFGHDWIEMRKNTVHDTYPRPTNGF